MDRKTLMHRILRKSSLNILLAVAILLFLSIPVTLWAQTQNPNPKTLKLKLGSVAPANTTWAKLLEDISSQIKEKSEGAIEIEIGYGGVFGGERELLRQCRKGKVPIVGVSSTIVASLIEELSIIELPYLFESYDEADYIIDNVFDSYISKRLEENGLVLLMWTENGYKNIASIKPVRNSSDLKGLKIRSQKSSVYRKIFESFGACPVQLSVRGVVRGLQSGVLEGFDNTPLFTYSSGLYHHVKYYTLTEHSYQPILMLMSKKIYDNLESIQQKTIMDAMSTNKLAGRKKVRATMAKTTSKLAENGIIVIKLDEQARNDFRNTAKLVYKDLGSIMNSKTLDLFEKVQKELAAFRKTKYSAGK